MKNLISSLESLEARIAPAAVFVDASSLKVSLTAGVLKVAPLVANASVDITIEQLANGDFLVSDASGDDDLEPTADLTGPVNVISVATGAGDDTVHLALHGDVALRSGIVIATGTGDDTVDISEGVLKGSLTITTKGASDIFVGDPGAELSVKGGVKIKQVGGSVSFGDGASAGFLSATGATDFSLLGHVLGAATLKATAPASFALGTDLASPAASVGGKLTVTGSTGADFLDLAHILVRGAASVNLGNGDNVTTANSGATFYGAAKFAGGLGNDAVTLGSAADAGPQFHGRVSLVLGAATTANEFAARSGFFAGGLAYSGTTGADHVAIGARTTIYSDLSIVAGDGANTATIETFSDLSKFAYLGGLGVDTLTLAGQGAGYVTGKAKLGDGADSLTVAPTAGDFFLAFLVDGGAGNDTSSVPAAVSADGFLKVNFGA